MKVISSVLMTVISVLMTVTSVFHQYLCSVYRDEFLRLEFYYDEIKYERFREEAVYPVSYLCHVILAQSVSFSTEFVKTKLSLFGLASYAAT